jgi:hypothetical protein
MSEIKHWLDESSDADDFERAILRSGLDPDPSPAQCAEVWAGITGTLALTPLVTTAAAGTAKAAVGSASKTATVWLSVGKGFVLGLAVYGAATGLSEVSQSLSAPHATPITTSTASPSTAKHALPRVAPLAPTPTPEPAAAEAAAAPSSVGTSSTLPAAVTSNGVLAVSPSVGASSVAALPSVAAFDDPASGTRASQLRAEAQALRAARAALRSGRLADAFATLEASRRQFLAPELYQEREALMIELLQRSGQTSAAKERAQAFLSRFPESPHAEQLRLLVLR